MGGFSARRTHTGAALEDALVDARFRRSRAWRSGRQNRDLGQFPSAPPTLISDFAQRLAQGLQLPLANALEQFSSIRPNPNAKQLPAGSNIIDHFAVTPRLNGQYVLLVDDIADSKWTLTVLGDLLQTQWQRRGFPFALAGRICRIERDNSILDS